MIFRKYRTLFLALIICGLAVLLIKAVPHLAGAPSQDGIPQGNAAGYPFRSMDRSLIDLNGTWQSFSSLRAAENAFGPTVEKEIYGVGGSVYGKAGSEKGVEVPGSWNSAVAVRQFNLGNELAARNFRLHILGSGGPVEVFVNGFSPAESVGEVAGGRVPAYINIPTPRLRFGQLNTVAVKLKNSNGLGQWFNFPGLTGEVYLEAEGSIFLDSPAIVTSLKGDGGVELSYSIPVSSKVQGDNLTGQVTLVDASGNVAAANSFSLKNGPQMLVVGKLQVPQPRLWSPGDPYLYRLEVFINAAGGERDLYYFPVGLREIKYNSGITLNGHKFDPKVLIRVNDSIGGANASTLETDIKWAKANGYNTLFLPDSPPQPYLLDLADRFGLLVLGQASAGGASFGEDWLRSLREVNGVQKALGFHPSFAAQGLGPELDTQDPKFTDYVKQASGLGPVFYTVLGKPDKLVFSGGGQLELNAPYLADFIAVKPSFSGSGFVPTHIHLAGILTRERTEKGQEPLDKAKTEFPPFLPLVAGAIALLLIFRSWGLDNLRFSNLAEARPKRKLRDQVKQHAYWYLLRLAVLALIPTQLLAQYGSIPLADIYIETIPYPSLQILAWYFLENPWALFLGLFCAGLALSLLLAWPRARTLPGKPGAVAFLLWQEKRKRWITLVLGAWIFALYGGPYWLIGALLVAGYGLSRWSESKDIRWAGGKTFNLAYFACFTVLLIIFVVFNWEILKYMYHWAKV